MAGYSTVEYLMRSFLVFPFNPHRSKLQQSTAPTYYNYINIMLYLLHHFKITGYSCNLIGSQQCDLFPNRTTFCSKLHLFASQWGWDSKTKQPIIFQGFFKLTNNIAGNERQKIHCLANLATFVVLVVHVFRLLNCAISKWILRIKWQLNFRSCNFGLKSYLWFCALVRF